LLTAMLTTLVDTETLSRHLDDPRWVVVDCRFVLTDPEAGRRAYTAGHIPGARYAHLDEDLSSHIMPTSGRHPLPYPNTLAEKLGRWGIDKTSQVVVYDDSFGAMAARLWWLLRWLGHEAVAVLDAGYPKWVREKRPVTIDLPKDSNDRTLYDLWCHITGRDPNAKPDGVRGDEYRCSSCRGVFKKAIDDAEALADDGKRFTPEEMAGPLAIVCDDCWNAMDAAGAIPPEPKGPRDE